MFQKGKPIKMFYAGLSKKAWMPFECKKYHCKCEAKCCGIVPIPASIWQKNQHNIQRLVISKQRVMAGQNNQVARLSILPITEDFYCPFLKQDLSCAIYNDRSEICRKFGDESHLMLCCPVQKADGTPRTAEEASQMDEQVDAYLRSKH
jgi:Fe-S-cluster containining protein